jgi:hypothetical protein
MGLVLNKAKRQTVADLINGAGIIGLLVTIGIYVYLPISKIIKSEQMVSIADFFPIDTSLLASLPILSLSILLLFVSAKLKKDSSLLSTTYENLGPGNLLLVLLFFVWVVLPLIGGFVGTILMIKK